MDTFDEFGRPSWDSWFMAMCFVISQRSIDPETKHGCIFVAPDKTILSIGYNGPPRGCDDSKIKLTRPEKYLSMLHAEEAAICNAARHGIQLQDAVAYISGKPCEKCLRMMINVGIAKVCHGNVSSHCINAESNDIIDTILSGQKITLVPTTGSSAVPLIFKNTLEYLHRKGICYIGDE